MKIYVQRKYVTTRNTEQFDMSLLGLVIVRINYHFTFKHQNINYIINNVRQLVFPLRKPGQQTNNVELQQSFAFYQVIRKYASQICVLLARSGGKLQNNFDLLR
ncbi:Hypothetical_protein [Hexamita inflata]|uniref:Hypothetical_protein n=1 Tax=Hexamita inflata TaxID=28002 RepID=A0AA86NED3_9EUKA|nr:Hypothetical protein HINF_LOCUS5396 [Hexamita inflata]CAI9946979.1 Hypothetical protein HINF_LOCUS34624 [Hexamita inflata]